MFEKNRMDKGQINISIFKRHINNFQCSMPWLLQLYPVAFWYQSQIFSIQSSYFHPEAGKIFHKDRHRIVLLIKNRVQDESGRYSMNPSWTQDTSWSRKVVSTILWPQYASGISLLPWGCHCRHSHTVCAKCSGDTKTIGVFLEGFLCLNLI